MKYTQNEKQEIFRALVSKYTEYHRAEFQAQNMFSGKKLEEFLQNISKQKQSSLKLLIKTGKDAEVKDVEKTFNEALKKEIVNFETIK